MARRGLRAHQLEVVAELISQSPGKTILKRRLDPSQDAPRPNVDHISRQLRAAAVKSSRNPKIPHLMVIPKCGEGVETIELVPYDRYLWLFLKGMDKHPPGNTVDSSASTLMQRWNDTKKEATRSKLNESFFSMEDLRKELSQMETKGETKGESWPKMYDYPKNIAEDLDVVLKGLMYVYTGPSSPLGMVP